jgi:hypothetical protein
MFHVAIWYVSVLWSCKWPRLCQDILTVGCSVWTTLVSLSAFSTRTIVLRRVAVYLTVSASMNGETACRLAVVPSCLGWPFLNAFLILTNRGRTHKFRSRHSSPRTNGQLATGNGRYSDMCNKHVLLDSSLSRRRSPPPQTHTHLCWDILFGASCSVKPVTW